MLLGGRFVLRMLLKRYESGTSGIRDDTAAFRCLSAELPLPAGALIVILHCYSTDLTSRKERICSAVSLSLYSQIRQCAELKRHHLSLLSELVSTSLSGVGAAQGASVTARAGGAVGSFFRPEAVESDCCLCLLPAPVSPDAPDWQLAEIRLLDAVFSCCTACPFSCPDLVRRCARGSLSSFCKAASSLLTLLTLSLVTATCLSGL